MTGHRMHFIKRNLGWVNITSNFWNNTFDEANDFTSQLRPASDISVDSVMTSLYFNAVVFVALLASYEILRRLLPSVYAAKKRNRYTPSNGKNQSRRLKRTASLSKLPDSSYIPLDWVAPVFGVSWSTVRRAAGLDAYFFLRFIRMCVRITSVSTFWAAIILAPTYATGNNGAEGWYRISMTNIDVHEWRMMIPVIFIYLFSTFTFFVLKQEFSHFMDLRMDFLGREEANVDPQHHFSLMVENIPDMLRSDQALHDYFEKLFPGKVHSASVIIRLPSMDSLAGRGLRVTKRLEKAIAVYHATGQRPSHMLEQPRIKLCGIDFGVPFDCLRSGRQACGRDCDAVMVNASGPIPPPGSRVDSISYFTRDLIECNREMQATQQAGRTVAEKGALADNEEDEGNWFVAMVDAATDAASIVMEDSEFSNNLRKPHDSFLFHDEAAIPQAEQMSSRYGSFGPPSPSISLAMRKGGNLRNSLPDKTEPLMVLEKASVSFDQSINWTSTADSDNTARLFAENADPNNPYSEKMSKHYKQPFARSNYQSTIRRWVGRLGLDFLVAGIKYSNRQLDLLVANVVGVKHSSTGFVTFLDLRSVSTAASAPLTHKPNVLQAHIAPEPRDLRWKSASIPAKLVQRRENYTNIFLSLGIILWSIPLTAIQAFATAEKVALLPGMEWILTIAGGQYVGFINGYLPVVALLCLIMILPVFFEFVAVRYEHRKTLSDVQRSMLGRYFYYQLANIYLTVTAGSLWQSLADILESPRSVLEILGQSLPKVVGYFISLLITKILAGLPIIVLRVGALGRMLLLRAYFSKGKLTQRELNGIYRRENLLYGWEYPSQLLVIVICFTYVCICPIILPFGAIYFVGSLMVYKKQALYVYTPLYESGGAMFPHACDCLMFGLTCSQTVLIGYAVIRQCFYEPFIMMPLPFITIWIGRYFRRNYAVASRQMSLERAMERDRLSDLKVALNKHRPHVPGLAREERRQQFEECSYRQPVLKSSYMEPMSYRRDEIDHVTEGVTQVLREMHELDLQEIIQRPSTVMEAPSSAEKSLDPMDLPTSNSEYI